MGKNDIPYKDDVSISVYKMKSRSQQGGWFRSLMAARGYRLIATYIEANNTGQTEQVVNLEDFYLIDSLKREKFPLISSYVSNELFSTRSKLKLSAQEKSKRVLLFSYPEKSKPSCIIVGDKSYPLVYAN